jgi:hypothetical protein
VGRIRCLESGSRDDIRLSGGRYAVRRIGRQASIFLGSLSCAASCKAFGMLTRLEVGRISIRSKPDWEQVQPGRAVGGGQPLDTDEAGISERERSFQVRCAGGDSRFPPDDASLEGRNGQSLLLSWLAVGRESRLPRLLQLAVRRDSGFPAILRRRVGRESDLPRLRREKLRRESELPSLQRLEARREGHLPP